MNRHLISTTAKPATCPRCGAPTLTAHDEGLAATVDAHPITAADETRALLAGRATYTLTTTRQLIHRDAARIRSGRPRGTIHAAHACPRHHQPTLL